MKNYSIKYITYTALICLVIVSIVAQIVIFSIMNVLNNQKKQEVSDAVATYIKSYVEQKIDETQNILQKFYGDADVLDMLDCEDMREKEEKKINISERLDVLRASGEELPYVVIFDDDNSYRLTTNIDENEYENLLNVYKDYKDNALSEEELSEGVYCDFFTSNRFGIEEMYICSVRKIYKYDFTVFSKVEKGTMMVASKINTKRMLVEIGGITGIDIKVTNLYSGKQSSFSMKNYVNDKIKMQNSIHTLNLSNTKWEISEYWQEKQEILIIRIIQKILFLEIFINLMVLLLLNFFLKKGIISPVEEIVDYLNKYNLTSRQSKLEINGTKEINHIVNNINLLISNVRNMSRKLIANQQKLYEIEISNLNTNFYALQNQINPHFICNILECLRGIALQNKLYDVADSFANVSDMMRYALRADEMVTLGDELYNIEKYIKIMTIRYPDMFCVSIDVPEELKSVKIIKMTVQPIVENAFINGRFFKNKKGILKIKAYVDEKTQKIMLNVYDNGVGFSQTRKREIEEKLSENVKTITSPKSLGLVNTNSRLKMKWGNDFGISINSVEGEYSEILITIAPDIQK